ncbi:MAG: hypothetical protein ACRC2T_01095, partial [Thermoguttaceae bacterium]
RYKEEATATNMSGEGNWLNPLPHPYGPFAYRNDSPTKGLGGEPNPIQLASFEPYQAKPIEDSDLYDWEKETDKDFDWSMFDPANFVLKIRDWMGMGPNEKKAAAFMEEGYTIIRQNRDFKDISMNVKAAKLFEKAASRWPDSVLEEDALFLAGECYFFSEKYTYAEKNYAKLVSKHHGTKYMDKATQRLFKIGKYWEEKCDRGASFVNVNDKTRPTFDTFGAMKRAYETVYTYDPMGPYGDQALMSLAGAFMNRGVNEGDSQYAEAAILYASLPDINSRSHYIPQAKKLELLAKSMSYEGEKYDGTALDEATVLADHIQRTYGNTLGDEKEDILNLKDSLTTKRAERLWDAALYYEKKKMYSSARSYYEAIFTEYPTFPLYAQAEENYARIKDLEDADDKMKWLKKIIKPKDR